MSIEQQLKEQLKEAMRNKDSDTSNTIRMINSEILKVKKEKNFDGNVGNELYEKVIAAYQKKMKKARAEYEKIGEQGAGEVASLTKEIEFCGQFLPKPLSESDVEALVKKAIEETGASDPKMAGRIVGMVMKDNKGRVDAGMVKSLAEKMLSA